jgi:hypothetical protein
MLRSASSPRRALRHLPFALLLLALVVPAQASALSISFTQRPPGQILTGVRGTVKVGASISLSGCKANDMGFPRWLIKNPGSASFYPSYGNRAGNSLSADLWWPSAGAGAIYGYVTCVTSSGTLLTAQTDVASYTFVDRLPTPPPTPPTVCPAQAGAQPCNRPAIPVPVLEKAKRQLTDPCPLDADPANIDEYVKNCTAAQAKADQVAQTGPPMICTLQTFIGPGFILRRGFLGKARDCVARYGPWARKNSVTRARAGAYRGFTTPLATGDRVPTKKQVLSTGRALARLVVRKTRPRGAKPISLKVAGGSRSTTFEPQMTLACARGGKLAVRLRDAAGSADDLAVKGGRSFSTTVKDRLSAVHASGRFFRAPKRVRRRNLVAGITHVSIASLHRGRCAGTVGFAARR